MKKSFKKYLKSLKKSLKSFKFSGRKNPSKSEMLDNINENLVDKGLPTISLDEYKDWYAIKTGIPRSPKQQSKSITNNDTKIQKIQTKLEYFRKNPVKNAKKIQELELELYELV